MKTYLAHLKSTAPYSQSRYHDKPKLEKESPSDYENRTWQNRIQFDENGFVWISPMALKICLENAAKYLNMKIPGQRNATYTKHFLSGLLIIDKLVTKARQEDVIKETFLVPADGKRGGGTRVVKHFPMIPEWETKVNVHILDEVITKVVLTQVIEEAGKFIGLGRFRPQNGGFYGRFKLESLSEVPDDKA